MFSRYSFCFLVILSVLFCIPAQATNVFVKKGKAYKKTNWMTSSEKKWVKNEEGVPVLVEELQIKLPIKVKKVKSLRSSPMKLTDGGAQLEVQLGAMKDKVLIKGRKKRILMIKGDRESDIIDNTLCEDQKLYVEKGGSDMSFPFRVDINCYEKEGEDFLVIVVPQEVRWSSTTIPENNGKGERWKEYRIEDLPTGESHIRGEFSFRYKKKSFKFFLKSREQEEGIVAKDTKTTNFYLGGGLMNLSVSSDISDRSHTPLAFLATVETLTSWWGIRAGMSLILPKGEAQSSEGAEKSLQFLEGRLFVAKDFLLGDSFKVYPMLIGVFSETSDPNVLLKIAHQHFGIGGGALYNINESWFVQGDLWMTGFLASLPVSHMALQMRVNWQLWESIGLGIEVGQQNITVQGLAGSENAMSEMHYGVFMKF